MSSFARRRSAARRAAVQALYQWQLTTQASREIAAQFAEDPRHADLDRDYFEGLLDGVAAGVASPDEALAPCLDRPVAQVDPVERAILRIGAFELAHRPDVPWRVVIDEAVSLAHTFGSEEGHRYVNAVLDRAARRLRPRETADRA